MTNDIRTTEQKRLDAQDLYIFTHYSNDEIAKFCDVTVRTIQNWIKESNWSDLKAANNLTRPKIVANLYKKMLQLSEEDVIENAQKISMLATAIEKFDKRANASHYINVFVNFNRFLVASGEVGLAQDFNKHQKNFLDAMSKKVRYV